MRRICNLYPEGRCFGPSKVSIEASFTLEEHLKFGSQDGTRSTLVVGFNNRSRSRIAPLN